MSNNTSGMPILFFDGVCGLCNRFIDFLFWIDQKPVYLVAALQGETAQKILPKEKTEKLNSLVVYRNGQILERSNAVLTILKDIGLPWSVFTIFFIVPLPIRDWVYDKIADSRYQIFGKTPTCRLPTPSERARFLD